MISRSLTGQSSGQGTRRTTDEKADEENDRDSGERFWLGMESQGEGRSSAHCFDNPLSRTSQSVPRPLLRTYGSGPYLDFKRTQRRGRRRGQQDSPCSTGHPKIPPTTRFAPN